METLDQEIPGLYPTFSQPVRQLDQLDPEMMTENPDESSQQESKPQKQSLWSKLKPQKDALALMATSTTRTRNPLSASEVENLALGIIGLCFVGAAWMYKTRTKRKLRMPTETEKFDIAAPLGRIASRHADLSLLGPDVTDTIHAGTALFAYINNAPLADGYYVDAGVPHDLQDEPEAPKEAFIVPENLPPGEYDPLTQPRPVAEGYMP